MKILQISDTHGLHRQLADLPAADVIVHCGDFTEAGTEEEVLDFLNWFAELPYAHKIFVAGNHDLCLWDAGGIEDLPEGMHFLQDCGCEIDGVCFFGLGYNHPETLIPDAVDVLVTHEPPVMILDRSTGVHWGKCFPAQPSVRNQPPLSSFRSRSRKLRNSPQIRHNLLQRLPPRRCPPPCPPAPPAGTGVGAL